MNDKNKKKVVYFGEKLSIEDFKPIKKSKTSLITNICCWIADRFHIVLMLISAIVVLNVMLKEII